MCVNLLHKYVFSTDFKLDRFREMIFSPVSQSCDRNKCIFHEKCQTKGLRQLCKLDRFKYLIQFCFVSFIISRIHANPRCHDMEILGKYNTREDYIYLYTGGSMHGTSIKIRLKHIIDKRYHWSWRFRIIFQKTRMWRATSYVIFSTLITDYDSLSPRDQLMLNHLLPICVNWCAINYNLTCPQKNC